MKRLLAVLLITVFSFAVHAGPRQDAFDKGHAADKEEKYEDAVKWFKKALELCKENEAVPKCWAYNNIGYVLLKQKKIKEALEYLENAVKAYDKIDVAWNNLGVAYENTYYEKNDKSWLEKAKEAYAKAAALKPDLEKYKLNKARVETLFKMHE